MRIFSLLLMLLGLGACVAGDIPPERQALYDANTPNCQTSPDKCIHGYPW